LHMRNEETVINQTIVVALAGNPNSGKSTIFNNLTGSHQHVGNYPGVTVERKDGFCRYDGLEMKVVDLPGTYSLTAYSAEEMIARNFVVEEKPDVVVDIIDASNLERNLYLAVQFMELGAPLVLAFNMSDEARARGYEFDLKKLSGFFNADIVPTVGNKNGGMDKLLEAIAAKAELRQEKASPLKINYGPEIEEEIDRIEAMVRRNGFQPANYDARWIAIKLLENDKGVFIHMWERGWLYLKKAGTVILGISILLWVIASYPKKEVFERDYDGELKHYEQELVSESDPEGIAIMVAKKAEILQARQPESLAHSLAGRIGRGIEPLLTPMGFDWKIGTALIGAFAAKEVFVAQMGIVYSVGDADEESNALRDRLRSRYSPLVAFCIMLFCLIGTPCMATVAVIRRESNSWRWALLQFGGLTALAYLLTVFAFQTGSLFKLGVG
jgi:small GTP-binding protein